MIIIIIIIMITIVTKNKNKQSIATKLSKEIDLRKGNQVGTRN